MTDKNLSPFPISIIAALGKSRQLGINGEIPWHVSADFKQFKAKTTGHALIMGRKTFESHKPLKGRLNIVLTRDEHYQFHHPEVIIVKNIEEAFVKANEYTQKNKLQEIFISGGSYIYDLCLDMADNLYLSYINYDGEADVFFPKYDEDQYLVKDEIFYDAKDNTPSWTYIHLERKKDKNV